jgi:hypothetical protein
MRRSLDNALLHSARNHDRRVLRPLQGRLHAVFESAKRPGDHRPRCGGTIMSISTTSPGFLILQHLSATKKLLQHVVIDVRYVWRGEIRCDWRIKICVCRITVTLDKAEVERTNESNATIATEACSILARRSRARHFRDPPPDSVLEEQGGNGQPDTSRNTRSHSRLLG